MADFGSELETFRAEARTWLEENFPKSLARAPDPEAEGGGEKPTGDAELWRQRMGAKGWGVPTWPKEYGGGGLSPAEAKVLQEEMAAVGARNPIGGMGVAMFGPTLLEYGTHEQKAEHIPFIARGERRWCQGFSEPGAGSDLAGLQTKAEDKGDHFLVNGQKIWTSGAQYADWCFCLTRTDQTKKHEGISFLMIPMHEGGVEPRPIRLINDTSPFCETFFTDVKVPKGNIVGPLNGGWTVAKRLLQHERQSISGVNGGGAPVTGAAGPIQDIAKEYLGVDEDGRLNDLDLRSRITVHLMDTAALALTGRRMADEAKSNRGPTAASSILKNQGSQNRKERAELAVEIMGLRGVGWEASEGFTKDEVNTIKGMLRTKSGTIAGGSQEVQWNIISKRILGLPDATRSV
ncbi:MAG: acyl-CoA dehydrogenase family protein [Caulobacteraceae bacterium]